jgi:hypothetical protein
MTMTTYPFIPGVPAAGHIARGYWHPGRAENCAKCEPPRPRQDDQRKPQPR